MPQSVIFPELGVADFPDSFTEEDIRAEAPRARQELIRRREARVAQQTQQQVMEAEHPYFWQRAITGQLSPEEMATVGARMWEAGGSQIASVPEYIGRIAETLPPEANLMTDEYGNVSPQSRELVARIAAARAGETPQQRIARIEESPLVKAGKALEEKAQLLPEGEPLAQTFLGGAVPQAAGSMLASLATAPLGGAGVFGTTFTAEANDAWKQEMQRQQDAGETPDPDKALRRSFLYGSIATGIEAKLGVGRVYRRIMEALRKTPPVLEEAVVKNTPSAIRSIAREFKGLGLESLAGGTEEGLQQMAEDFIVDGRVNLENAWQSAAAGAIVQGPTALTGAGVRGLRSARQQLAESTTPPAVGVARMIAETPIQAELPDWIEAQTRGYFPNYPGAGQVETGPQPIPPTGLVGVQQEPAMPLAPPTVISTGRQRGAAPLPEPQPEPEPTARRGPLRNQPSRRRPLIVPGEEEIPPERIDVISEIRRANANSVNKIRALFPQARLTGEQARMWRNLAFPPGYVAPRTEITYTPPEETVAPAVTQPTYTQEQLDDPKVIASILTNPNLTTDQKRSLIQTGSLPVAPAGGPSAGTIQTGMAVAGSQPTGPTTQIPTGVPGGVQPAPGGVTGGVTTTTTAPAPPTRRAPRPPPPGTTAPAPTTATQLTKPEQTELANLQQREISREITPEEFQRLMALRAKEWEAIQAARRATLKAPAPRRRLAATPAPAPAPTPAPTRGRKRAAVPPSPVVATPAPPETIKAADAHAALIGSVFNRTGSKSARLISGRAAMGEIAAGTPTGAKAIELMVRSGLVRPNAAADFIARTRALVDALKGTTHQIAAAAPVAPAPAPAAPAAPRTLPTGTTAPRRRALGAKPQAPLVIPQLTRETTTVEPTQEGYKLVDELGVDTGLKLTGEERRLSRVTTPFIFADPRILVAYQRSKAGKRTTEQLRKAPTLQEIGKAATVSGRESRGTRSHTRTHLLIFNRNTGVYHVLPIWRNEKGVVVIRERTTDERGQNFNTWSQTAPENGWDFWVRNPVYRVVLNRGQRFVNKTYTPEQVQSMRAAINSQYGTPTPRTGEEEATAFTNFVEQLQRGAATPEEAAAEGEEAGGALPELGTEEEFGMELPEVPGIPAKKGPRGYIPGGPERPESILLTRFPVLAENIDRLEKKVKGKKIGKPSAAAEFLLRASQSPEFRTRAVVKSLMREADRALTQSGFYDRYPYANKLQAQEIVISIALAQASQFAGKRRGSFASAITAAIDRVAQRQTTQPRRGFATGPAFEAVEPTESARLANLTVRGLGTTLQQQIDDNRKRGILTDDQAAGYSSRIKEAIEQRDMSILREVAAEVGSVIRAETPKDVKLTPQGTWEKMTKAEIAAAKKAREAEAAAGVVPTPLEGALSFPTLNWTQQKNGTYTAPATIDLLNWLRDPSVNNRKVAATLGIKFAKDKAGRSIAIAKQIPGTKTMFSLARDITNPMTVQQVEAAARRILRVSTLPKTIVVVNTPYTGDKRWRAKVDFGNGNPVITLNAAYLGSDSNVKEALMEEAIHIAFHDPSVSDLWKIVDRYVDRERMMDKIFEGYSDSEAVEEAANQLVREVNKTAEGRNWWQRLVDAVMSFLSRYGIESETLDPNIAQKLVARAILLAKGNTAITEPELSAEGRGIDRTAGVGPESSAYSLTFIPLSAWPESLRGDTPVDTKSAYGFIRNYFGPDGAVWKTIDTPEFRAFMQGTKTGGEILKWVQDHGPQVRVMEYGLSPDAGKEAAELQTLQHNWYDRLGEASMQIMVEAEQLAMDYGPDSRLVDRELAKLSSRDVPQARRYIHLWHKVFSSEREGHTEAPQAPEIYSTISPKDVNDHPVVRVDVVLPQREVLTTNELGEVESNALWAPDFTHEQVPNTLGWAAIQYETVNGEKVAHLFEVQSRWGQEVREATQRLSEGESGYRKRYTRHGRYLAALARESMTLDSQLVANAPAMLRDYNRLILKAAIDQARLAGATKIAISDAETAMMTEMHDIVQKHYVVEPTTMRKITEAYRADGYTGTRWEPNLLGLGYNLLNSANSLIGRFENGVYEAFDPDVDVASLDQFPALRQLGMRIKEGTIEEESGMRFNYDESYWSLRDASGRDSGVYSTKEAAEGAATAGQTPVKKTGALTQIARELTGDTGTAVDFGAHKNAGTFRFNITTGAPRFVLRDDLRFRTPTGEPKSNVTAMMYDISRVRPELSLFGRDKPKTRYSLVKPSNLVFGERKQVTRMTETPGLEPQQIRTIEQTAAAQAGLVDQDAAARIGTWRGGDNAEKIAAGILAPVLRIFQVGGNQLWQAGLEFMPPGLAPSQADLENRDVASRAVLFTDKSFQNLLDKIDTKRSDAYEQLQAAIKELPTSQLREIEASFHQAMANELLRGMGEHLRDISETGRLTDEQKVALNTLLAELQAKDSGSRSAIGVALLNIARNIPPEVLANTAAVLEDGSVVPLGTAGANPGTESIINWVKAQHTPPIAAAQEVNWLVTPDATGQSPLQSYTGLQSRLAELQGIIQDREGAIAKVKSFVDWFFANKPKQAEKASQVTLKQFANQFAKWKAQNQEAAKLAGIIRSDVRKWDDRFRGFSMAHDELRRMMDTPGYRSSINEATRYLGASEAEISVHDGTGIRYAAKGPLADLSPSERFIDYTPTEAAAERNSRNAVIIADRIQRWLQTDDADRNPAAAEAWRKENELLALHGIMHSAVQANYGQIGTRLFGIPSQFILSLGWPGPKQGLKRMLGRYMQIGYGKAVNAWGIVASGLDDIYRDSDYGWYPMQKAVIEAAKSHNIPIENIARDWKPLLSKIVARNQAAGSVKVGVGDRLPFGKTSVLITKEDMAAAAVMTKANNAIRSWVSQNKQFQELIDNPLKIVDKDLGIYRYVVAVKYLMQNPRTLSSEGMEFARKWKEAKDSEVTPEGEDTPLIEKRLALLAENPDVLNDYLFTSNPEFTQGGRFRGDELTRKAHAERTAQQRSDPSKDLSFYPDGKLTAVDEYADWLGRYKAEKNSSDPNVEISQAKKDLVAAFDAYTSAVMDEANPKKVENEASPVNVFANSSQGPLTTPRGLMVAPDYFYDYTTVTHTNYGNLRGKAMIPFLARVHHELGTVVEALRAAVADRKAYLKSIEPPGAFAQFRGKRKLRKEELAAAKAGKYVSSLKELSVMLRMAEVEKDRLSVNLAKATDQLYNSTAIDIARRAESLLSLPLLATPSATINNMMSAVFGSALIDTMAGQSSWWYRFPMEMLKLHGRVMKGTAMLAAKSKPLDAIFKAYPRLFSKITNLLLRWAQQEAVMAQINRDAGVGNKLNVMEHIEAIKRSPETYGDIESRDLSTMQKSLNSVMAALSGLVIKGKVIPGLEGARNWSQVVDNFTLKQVATRIMDNLDRVKEAMYDAIQARHDGETQVQNWNDPGRPLTPFTPKELGLTSFKDLETWRRWMLPAGNLEALALDYWNRAQAAGGYDAQADVPLLSDAQRNSVVREMFRYSGNPVDEANRITRIAATGGMSFVYQAMTRFQNWAANMASTFNALTEHDLRDVPARKAFLFLKVLVLLMISTLWTILGNEEKALARMVLSNDEPSTPRLAGVEGAGDFMRLAAASMASGLMPYYGELIARSMGTSANRPLLDLTGAIPLAGILARFGDAVTKTIQSDDPVLPMMDFIRNTMPYMQPVFNVAAQAGVEPLAGEAASRQASRAIRSAAPAEMEKTPATGGGAGGTLTPMTGMIRRAVDAAYSGDEEELRNQIEQAVKYQMGQGKSEDEARRSVAQSIQSKTPARRVLGKLPTEEEETRIVNRMTPTQEEDYNRSKEAFGLIGSVLGKPIPLVSPGRGGGVARRRPLLGASLFGITRRRGMRRVRGPSLGIPRRRRIIA